MDNLYQKIRLKKRKTRNRNVKVKLNLFLLATKLGNVREACERRGFSRAFYYKWWGRFKKSGYNIASLYEKSRRPRRSPNKISMSLEKKIRLLKRRGNGCRMIKGMLKREGIKLSHSTIIHVLNKRKKRMKKRKRKVLKGHWRRYELMIPGQRMQMDVKYVPGPVGGEKAYCYVIVDECTRWRFARAYNAINSHITEDFLNEIKKNCPFPVFCIQTDNGQEFTYRHRGWKMMKRHPMLLWCELNGIRHRLIPPGEKELNGKVERSHRIDMQYFYWRSPRKNFKLFNKKLDKWIAFYNEHRPHGGLNYITPMEKLEERLNNLGVEISDSEETRHMKLKFLKECPRTRTKIDRKLWQLEKELEKLLLAA